VVDHSLVVWARLLQHVVKHAGTSRGRSRALAGRDDREGLVLVLVAPQRARVAAGLLTFLAPRCRCCDDLLACSRRCGRIVDVEVSSDALAGLLA
jgi:hypothetical protein